MTAPKARMRNGDYLIAGRTFMGFTKTLNAGYPSSMGLSVWRRQNLTLYLAELIRDGQTGWVDAVLEPEQPDLRRKAAWPYVKSAESYDTAARDLGSDVHHAIEMVEMGAEVSSLDATVRRHVEGYLRSKKEHGIVSVFSERTVAHAEIGYAGTADHGMRVAGLPGVVIGDTKTGSLYPDKFGVQLAAYARCTHWLDGDDLVPLEGVNTKTGVILQVTEAGTRMHTIDLDAAWPAWLAAIDLRRWCEDAKDAITGPVEPIHERRVEWLRPRVQAVLDLGRDHIAVQALIGRWPEGCPPPKQHEAWTGHDIDRIAALLDEVERKLESPFAEPDPLRRAQRLAGTKAGVDVPAEAIEAMVARLKALPSDLLAEAEAAAVGAGVPKLTGGSVTAADMETVAAIVTTVEAKAADRMQVVIGRADGLGISPEDLAHLVTAGAHREPGRLTERHLERAVFVTRLWADGHLKTANRKVVTHDSLTNHLLLVHGTPDRVVAVAQAQIDGADDLPKGTVASLSAVASRPLLAALVAAHTTNPMSKEQCAS